MNYDAFPHSTVISSHRLACWCNSFAPSTDVHDFHSIKNAVKHTASCAAKKKQNEVYAHKAAVTHCRLCFYLAERSQPACGTCLVIITYLCTRASKHLCINSSSSTRCRIMERRWLSLLNIHDYMKNIMRYE
jgi:hypothetical protein